MDNEMERKPVAVHFHRNRIDEKRHIVVDDLNDRMRRLPAVLLDRRIEYAHTRMSPLSFAREVPVRQRGTVQIRRLSFEEILWIDLAVIPLDKSLQRGALLGRDPGRDELG